MSVKLALVRFCSERTNFVVDISDIQNFHPKHVEDFDKDKKYEVKWPILKRAESTTSTVADFYPAKILLLSVDEESMIHRAAAGSIRLPPAFLQAHPKSKTVRKSRKQEQSVLVKKSSKKSKKDIASAAAQEAKLRMQAIASKHSGGNIIIPDTCSSSNTDSGQRNPEKPSSLTGRSPSPSAEASVTVSTCEPNKLSPDVVSKAFQSETNETSEKLFCGSENLSVTAVQNSVDNLNSEIESDCASTLAVSDNEAVKSISDFNIKIAEKKSKKRKRVIESDDDTSVTSGTVHSWESAQNLKSVPLLKDRQQILSDKLAAEQRLSRRLRTEVISKDLLLERWKEAFQKFNEVGSNIIQDERDLQEVSPSKMFPHRTSPRVVEWVNNATTASPGSKNVKSTKPSAVKNLFKETDEGAQDTTLEGSPFTDKVSSPIKLYRNGSLSSTNIFKDSDGEAHVWTLKGSSSPGKMFRSGASLSSMKKPSKRTPLKKSPIKSQKASVKDKEKKLTPKLSTHEKRNTELAPMILDALKDTRPLQSDGAGNVHIGNNIYISQASWEDLIAPSSKPISLAIKNLVGAIYSVKEGSKLSVSGGKSPKTSTELKSAVPMGTLEAIYGVYRAKMMLQGVTNNEVLNQSVRDTAKRFVREKLSEMGKTVRREEKKFEELKSRRARKEESPQK